MLTDDERVAVNLQTQSLLRKSTAKQLNLFMVYEEAKQLVAEYDESGVVNVANIEALRGLLWRARSGV